MLIGKGKLSSKGWVVIPKDIRDALGLEPGDEVRFFLAPPLRDRDDASARALKIDRGRGSGRGKFKHLRGAERITEELVKEHRVEVEREERRSRDWRKPRRSSA